MSDIKARCPLGGCASVAHRERAGYGSAAYKRGVVRKVPVVPEFGFKLPNCGGVMCPPEWATPQTVERLALEAAGQGFDSLWLQDHVVTPEEMEEYGEPAFLDPFAVSVRLAALVPAVRIGVATYVLPFRDPVILAKQLATADRFFPGRFVVGVGAGRYESEFARFGSSLLEDRGRVTQEYMVLMRRLFQEARVTHEGKYRSVKDAMMNPRPPLGRIPIWLHGSGPIGIRRAARYADGWIAGSPLIDELRSSVAAYRAERVTTGREAGPIAVSLRVDRAAVGKDQTDHGIVHRGTADQVAATLSEFAAAGVTHVLLTFPARTVEELIDKMHWFTGEVRSVIRARGEVGVRQA